MFMNTNYSNSYSQNTIENRMDILFKKFANLLMKDGKKIKASKIIFTILLILQKRLQKELQKKNNLGSVSHLGQDITKKENFTNFELFGFVSQAIDNVTPSLEVRKVRVRGTTYLVPAVLSKKKQETLALKWLIESAKKRQKNSKFDFSTCLADEIFDASRKSGQARQKRDELHRLAQMNRAYIRYRWW